MVRKLDKNTMLKTRPLKLLGTGLVCLFISSCINPRTGKTGESGTSNSKSSVAAGYGRVLKDNPIILSGNASLSEDYNLAKLLGDQVPITNNTTLTRDCTGQVECLTVVEDENIEAFINSDKRWGYGVYTTEFLQINTFYHINKVMEKFYGALKNNLSNNLVVPYLNPTLSNSPYPTSLPMDLFAKKANVNPDRGLVAFADCNYSSNAYFDSGRFVLCFGYDPYFDKVKFAQDPTIIYHEYGHTLVHIMLNMRNAAYHFDTTPNVSFTNKSDLGTFSYDEAGAMNEGLADYFSFFINQRAHFAEWALGRDPITSSRPMKEDDSLHASGIEPDEAGRLSYPDFLNYDANNHSSKAEVRHNAGMILSHYLVALTEDIASKCSISKSTSSTIVVQLINETLSELGDLTSRGNDFYLGSNYSVNLNPTFAKEWFSAVNPVTYRKFAQTFAKYLKAVLVRNSVGQCVSGNYDTDDIETLLDQYGLLLFRGYNENGNGVNSPAWASGITTINPLNRKKSELIAKNLLKIESRSTFSKITIFDDRTTITSTIDSLLAQNNITQDSLSALTPANYGYNNGNGKISPGEIVGIYVNVFNDSNSNMGGVRVLANDWAHMENNKPCSNLSDAYPTLAQGGTTCSSLTATNFSNTDRFQPVCMIEYNNGSSTQLLSQGEYFTKMKAESGILEKDCLDPLNTKTCMIRAIKGASTQSLSKIGPKSNWLETIKNDKGQTSFSSGNLMFFEVNKNLPFGTNVVCRLRATFTNCDECSHDANSSFPGDDYKDWQYAGEAPFNIIDINFQISD